MQATSHDHSSLMLWTCNTMASVYIQTCQPEEAWTCRYVNAYVVSKNSSRAVSPLVWETTSRDGFGNHV